MNHSVAQVWKAVLGFLSATWRPLFLIHLAYAALGVLLLAPLTGALIRLLIGLSGRTVLADQDIAYFVLTPLGMASLILVAAVLIAIMALEQASMMAIGANLPSGPRSRILDALAFAAGRAHRILAFAVRLVARLLLLAAPFLLAGAAVAWLLITNYDINYYLQTRPAEFWIAAAIIGLLLAVMLSLVVRKLIAWSLALPLVLFLDVSPARSFGESERLTAGRRRLILRVIALWALAVLVMSALVLGVLRGLGGWIVPLFSESLAILVIVLGGLAALWFVANLLVSAFSLGTFALALVVLAERLAPGFEVAEGEQRPPSVRIPGAIGAPSRLIILLLTAAPIAALTGAWLVQGVEVRDDITIVAHRGAAGKAPENTLASVRQAIEDGADWVEIDVQESADDEVVVVHDSDFMKLAGVDLKVWDGTLDQIGTIDVGSWFDPAFAAERVPTLREVLESVRGRSRVVIELKYYGYDRDLERRVVEIVEEADMVSAVAVMSLEYTAIQKIRALRPDWTIGLLSATAVGDLTSLDADFLAVNMGMATPGFVRKARTAGKGVLVWTVNDPVSMSRMMSIGVDGIITDEPEMARKVVAERAGLSTVERLLIHTAVLFGEPVPPRIYRDNSP
jgi:glycerophosphoryl diester phosphodiesterase